MAVVFFTSVVSFGWSTSLRALDQSVLEKALQMPEKTKGLVFRESLRLNWLEDGHRCWYQVQTGHKTHEFVLIDAKTGERTASNSLARLKLPEAPVVRTSELELIDRKTDRNGAAGKMRLENQLDEAVELFWIDGNGKHHSYGLVQADGERELGTYDGHVWLFQTESGEKLAFLEAQASRQAVIVDGKGKASKPSTDEDRPGTSPDGKWRAEVLDGRLRVRDLVSGEVVPSPSNLESAAPFQKRIAWAPDSSAFVACSTPEYSPRQITIVDSSPEDRLEPKAIEIDYIKPGDPLPQPSPVLFRRTETSFAGQAIDRELFPTPFTTSRNIDVDWSPDSREFYFNYNQRGHQLYRVLAVDRETGHVRVVVEETSKTFIDYTHKTYRHWLHDTYELIWTSERDGWNHLWLYDSRSGKVKNRLTEGAWPVREIVRVDDEKRQVWFMASGLRAGEDPYHSHLCRVDFDGKNFVQLTSDDGHHRVEFSPNFEYFLDVWSRVDLPTTHALRNSSDGSLSATLETADTGELLESGWQMPERFVAKGRDGETDIHGIIIKPTHFDPSRRYPVVEQVYAGPHSAFVPKTFDRLTRQHQIAELGFIVVQADGLGTNHRGKRFHDVCWKNLKDAGFPDRIAWMKAAAATRPWMDIERVGIYGGSAGGQSAMRALLDHHDFYDVAVADCGCHDNRMDKIWWNEQWMGWPIDESYITNSNTEEAHKLRGDLMLVVGELDRNVDPASTMQVVGALQKAGKPFTFLPVVGVGHGAAETPYANRRRMEFLVEHLIE